VILVLLTNHVLSGALIGALTRRPLPAFAAGVASHFVLDAMPHWGKWGSRRRFLRAAVPDGLASLAVMGALAAVSPADRRVAVVAGMSGAALPDLDKPIKLWFGRSPFPKAVDRFHGRIQREAAGRAHLELLAAGALAAAALAAIRRPPAGRRRRRTRSMPLSSGWLSLRERHCRARSCSVLYMRRSAPRQVPIRDGVTFSRSS
jgi:hypothetical protein